jgi:hypothetical protein
MKYRIKVLTEASGTKWFIPQYQVFWFIWLSWDKLVGYETSEIIRFPTSIEAREYLNQEVEKLNRKLSKQIIKKEIIDYA